MEVFFVIIENTHIDAQDLVQLYRSQVFPGRDQDLKTVKLPR